MAVVTPRVAASPHVLRFARTEAGFDLAEAARRAAIGVDRLAEFESEEGEREPTLGQLRKLAELYDRTLAFFLLPVPPESDLPTVPDFRSLGDDGLSAAVRREMRRAERRRRVLVDLEQMSGWDLMDVGFTGTDDETAAALVRDRLGVSVEDQRAQRGQDDALRMWIAALEEAGTIIFQMSRVSSDECRGFSVFHEVGPVVVLNGGEPPGARAFTLMHELGHLLLRDGGICTVWNNQQTERRCNRFAAEVLMPRSAVGEIAFGEDSDHDVDRVARAFHVSRDAAAIRLRELQLITQDDVDAVRADTVERLAAARAKQRESEGGPPHYRTHLRNLGERYVGSVLDAFESGRIDFADVTSFLEAKTSTVDRMTSQIEGRGR